MIGLPGRKNIGLGRHWHGLGTTLWMLNGIVYVVLLFGTGLWRRIIPTSWDIFPQAWDSLVMYLGFTKPSVEHFQPYDALQMLGYTFIIFVVAPLMILTGLAMAPAIRNRFPRYVKFWGGHQGARSIHFILHGHHDPVYRHAREPRLYRSRRIQPAANDLRSERSGAVCAGVYDCARHDYYRDLLLRSSCPDWSLADRPRAQRFLVKVTELSS